MKKIKRKEEYNLDTALLIEPNNEEAILMLMKIALRNQITQKLKIFPKHL
jgi:hypothetical protein